MTKTDACPDSRLLFDPEAMHLREFPRAFFRGDTREIGRRLVGTWFARRHSGQWYGARIVETEAYLGMEDAAAHSYRGRRTPRVEPMYMDGGHLYVYFVYGMHHCANVVTRRAGIAEAVLLRAAECPDGSNARLLSGPGRFCAALGLTRSFNGADLLKGGDVRLFRGRGGAPRIGITVRIGVDYSGEAKTWPLRFFDRDSSAVSGPARLKKELQMTNYE